MRFLTINLKCLSAREKRKAQFKPKEALKRTKEMALRKSLSWICFLRGKSEFANLPLSLSLYFCLSLPTHQHAHTCSFGQGDTTHRHTHKAEFALSIFTHTIVFCYYVYAAYLFNSLTHSLSISLSLSLFLTFRWHPLYCKIYANKSK